MIKTDLKVKLIDNLKISFEEIKYDKKLQIQIDDLLNEHGILYGTLNEVMINPDELENWSTEELCVLTNALYTVTKNPDISPNIYFSEIEIKKAKSYKKRKAEFEYPYVLRGVLKGSDILYSTFLTFNEAKLLWENGVITYNIKVQRLPKEVKRKDGTTVLLPDIKPKSVKDIANLMKSYRYKSNSLILNILANGNDEIEYEDGNLIIHEGTEINIIDGAHRLEAAITTLEEDPDYEGTLPVLIYHLPLEEAQDCLSQVNTFNPFDKTLVKYYGNKKISDQIVKEVMTIPELANRVQIKTFIGKKSNYLTNFSVLTESVDAVFEPQTTKDRFDAVYVLKRFFSYLISYYENEFVTNFQETRNKSWMVHHNTFAGYVVLAKKLFDKYGKDFPVEKISQAIDSIDFRKIDGLPYNDIISPQGKVNSNVIKRNIREFFEKIEV